MAGTSHYKNRVDNTQKEIIEAFKSLGYYVLNIHDAKNCFDLIVTKGKNDTYFIECKSLNGTLTDAEIKVHLECLHPIHILTSAHQVYELVLKGIYNEPKRITKQLKEYDTRNE